MIILPRTGSKGFNYEIKLEARLGGFNYKVKLMLNFMKLARAILSKYDEIVSSHARTAFM